MPTARHDKPAAAAGGAAVASTERWAALTKYAFILALALVIARATLSETLREPFDPAPGAEAAPRGAGPATSILLDLLCALPALLILLRRTLDPAYVLRLSWTYALFGVLSIWMLASVAWSADRFAALVHSLNFVSALLLIWSAAQLVRSWQRLRLVAASVFGILLVYVACGVEYRLIELPRLLADFETNRERYLGERGLEAGTFQAQQFEQKLRGGDVGCFATSPNTYAAATVMMFLVTLGVIIQRQRDRDAVGWVIAPALVLPAAAFVLYHTHSLAAAITPFLGLALLVLFALARPWLAAHARFAYFTVVALFFAGCLAVVGHGLYHDSLLIRTMTFRWHYWRGAAAVFAGHPLLGVGWGNFAYHYLAVRGPLATEEVKDPHNFIVRFFTELGLPGGILLLAAMLRLWWDMCRPIMPASAAAAPPARRAILSIAGLAALAMLLNSALSLDWSQSSSYLVWETFRRAIALLLLIAAIAVVSLRSFREEQFDDRAAPWLLYAMTVAAGIFLIHNLIDFSLFEAGPLHVLALIVGSILGVRHPSVAGRTKKTLPVIIASVLATLSWLAILGFVYAPTAAADTAAAEADVVMRASRFAEAFRRYGEAMRHQPLNGDHAFRAAQAAAYANSNPQYVRDMLRAAIAANPLAIRYHAWSAEFELAQAQPDAQAVQLAYQEALRLNPRDVSLRIAYADALVKLGDHRAAAEQYREALRYDDQLPSDEPKRLAPSQRAAVEQSARDAEAA